MFEGLEQFLQAPATGIGPVSWFEGGVAGISMTVCAILYRRCIALEERSHNEAVAYARALGESQTVLKDAVKTVERLDATNKEMIDAFRDLERDIRAR